MPPWDHAPPQLRPGCQAPAVPRLPPAPPYDLQASHSVVCIEADPSRPTGRMVFLDGHESSYIDLADPTHLEFSYLRRIGDVIDLIRPPRQPLDVLHVGGGGFTLPRYVAATRPRSRQMVFEYGADLVRIARQHLGLAASPALRVRVGDARARLAERPDASADVVIGDAFSGVVLTVLNNSTIRGLADRAASEAQSRGWQVAQVGNFAGRLAVPTVFYTPGDTAGQAAAGELAREFPQIDQVLPRYAGLPPTPAGIVLVVTKDW